MRLTVLGTGTSFGVPQVGCHCAVCRSADPRDRRTRTAAVFQSGESTILVDTPCELRLQLAAAGIQRVDAVLYTHEHADHVGGIDDLRVFSIRRPTPLPCYGPPATADYLRTAYRYIFDDGTPVPEGTSKPRLELHPLESGVPASVAGAEVLPIAFDHGHSAVFGYRIGPAAYVTDVKAVPPAAIAREQLRPGVTLLGPPPHVTWPRATYRLSGGSASIPLGLVPPSLALPAPGRPVPRAPQSLTGAPRGGEPGVQLAPLAAPPMTAWAAFPGSVDWAPQSAFPAAEPGSPYPWNPVHWSGGAGLGNTWNPTSAWPPGVNAENWSPVLWSSPPAWTDWQPRDAWDRLLEPEESGAREAGAGSAIEPSGTSRQD